MYLLERKKKPQEVSDKKMCKVLVGRRWIYRVPIHTSFKRFFNIWNLRQFEIRKYEYHNEKYSFYPDFLYPCLEGLFSSRLPSTCTRNNSGWKCLILPNKSNVHIFILFIQTYGESGNLPEGFYHGTITLANKIWLFQSLFDKLWFFDNL